MSVIDINHHVGLRESFVIAVGWCCTERNFFWEEDWRVRGTKWNFSSMFT